MAHHADPADEALSALAYFFVDDGTLGDTLRRLVAIATRAAGADMAGITVLTEGKPRTTAFTDPAAPEIDEAQYSTGEGPCLDAFRQDRSFWIDSTLEDDRWPAFCRSAADHGVLSSLSVPIDARGTSLGALNLYSYERSAFDEGSVGPMETFARHAAVVLVNTLVYWDARHLNENLNQAMRSRSTIDYATGILMANGGRSAEDAFRVLVRASQRENRKLRDIAAEIVERSSHRRPTGEAQGG